MQDYLSFLPSGRQKQVYEYIDKHPGHGTDAKLQKWSLAISMEIYHQIFMTLHINAIVK